MNTVDFPKDPFLWLSSLQRFGIKLGLEQMRELLERLGNPEHELRFIHLAGTNGKGSVGAMLNSALQAVGFRPGFYSSPHLVHVRERFRVAGQAVSRDELCRAIEMIRPSVELMAGEGRCPTYFEVTTALAALLFRDLRADPIVWETGLGGRYDASNVVIPLISIITGIGLDHTAQLGDNPGAIAREKAGIIKPLTKLVCATMPAEAMTEIVSVATALKAPLLLADQAVEELSSSGEVPRLVRWRNYRFPLSLPGKIQLQNAATAACALAELAEQLKFDIADALAGFGKASWPGRRQLLPDGTLLDGAHNPDAVRALAVEFAADFRPRLVFGCLADKDAAGMLAELADYVADAVFVPVAGERSCFDPSGLLDIWDKLETGKSGASAGGLAEALALPRKNVCLITGSLYLAGQALALYYTEDEVVDL